MPNRDEMKFYVVDERGLSICDFYLKREPPEPYSREAKEEVAMLAYKIRKALDAEARGWIGFGKAQATKNRDGSLIYNKEKKENE